MARRRPLQSIAAPFSASANRSCWARLTATSPAIRRTPTSTTGAVQRKREQKLLGAPDGYVAGNPQDANIDNGRRAALLDEQRMTVTDGEQAGKPGAAGKRKAPPVANGQLRVADAAARPRADDKLVPQGAAKATYADPYTMGKRSVYRSPW